MPETLTPPVETPATPPVTPPVVTPPAITPPATAPAVTPPVATPPAVEPSILGGAKADSKETKTEVKTEATVAPEKYVEFKLPEGVQLDKTMLEKATPLFQKYKLSQEAAQEFVTFQAESVKASREASLADFNKTVEGWRAETMKFLGNEPAKESAYAGKALDAFGSPELRTFLDQTGIGNQPLLAKMLIAVGKAMSEAKTIEGTRTVPMDPLTETKLAMFPSMEAMIRGNGKK